VNRSERASQIWAVLAWAAKNRQSLTYGHLAKLIGVPTAGLGQLLEPIQSYCIAQGLPPLTVLVVQQESGLPGSGFTGASASQFASAQAEVFAKDWLEYGNPQPDKLELAVQQHPSNGPQGG
jgi:alkylated DNA nucleotide flippase Atl1